MKIAGSILILLSLLGCTSPAPKKTVERQHEIRVFNLKAVFDYVSGRDPEYKPLILKRELLLKNIAGMKERGETPAAISVLRDELAALSAAGEPHKDRIYSLIKTAVTEYSEKNGIDFVFNITEGGIYADRKYDITEDIILEVKRILKRSDPAAR